MLFKEKGSVLVLSLLVVIVLLIFVLALFSSVNNEVKISSIEENRIKAFYLAEAGLDKAIHQLKNRRTIPKGKQDLGNGNYQLSIKPTLSNPITSGRYTVTSIGIVNGRKKTISQELDIIVNSKGVVFISHVDKLKTKDTDCSNGRPITNANVLAQCCDDIPIAEFNNDKLKQISTMFWDCDHTYTGGWSAGKKYFVQGKLTIKGNISGTQTRPIIIMIGSELCINQYVELKNVYIFTANASHIDAPIKARNTLIYSNSDIIITDKEYPYKNFDFQGYIINPTGYVKFALENGENAKFDNGTIDYSKIPSELFNRTSLAEYIDEKPLGGDFDISITPDVSSWTEY